MGARASFEVPPVKAMTGEPVRPWKSMPAVVSARIGVLRSTAMVASTWRASAALSSNAVISPTRMPLNRTAEPASSPDTGLSKRTWYMARARSTPALLSQ